MKVDTFHYRIGKKKHLKGKGFSNPHLGIQWPHGMHLGLMGPIQFTFPGLIVALY